MNSCQKENNEDIGLYEQTLINKCEISFLYQPSL